VRATVRPGKAGGHEDALVHLEISKPANASWNHHAGMYALINMPDYAPLQWHPFTIASGPHDQHVEFVIAGVGDWTQHLAKRCIDQDLPEIRLDGPYAAPTIRALSGEVLIAVGAGVGITPFLSLMSTIIERFDEAGSSSMPLQVAHFYWMARSSDEFLFGRRHFSRIAASSELQKKVFVHLHVTAKDSQDNAMPYLFREAVRRQSTLDRTAFKSLKNPAACIGTQFPWCWFSGAMQDVMWLSGLATMAAGDSEERDVEAGGRSSSRTRTSVMAPGWAVELSDAESGAGSDRLDEPATSVNTPLPDLQPANLLANDVLLPIVFGRPDFNKEFRAIGHLRPCDDVNVYVCGSHALVESLQQVCSTCNKEARDESQEGDVDRLAQKYKVRFERFG